MFDFIRKPLLWKAWDEGLHRKIEKIPRFCLKSAQDLAVFFYLRDIKGKVIGEIGGGNSRILGALAKKNTCFNIEKFEGDGAGPQKEVAIPGVQNKRVFLGEFSDALKPNSFDVLCSISVVEHVRDLDPFLEDGLRVLKPGGAWLHAIDIYVEDQQNESRNSRFEAYRRWFDNPGLTPEGEIYRGPLQFTCDLVSNPDDTMHSWGRVAPSLIPLRQRAQCVSVLVYGRKA